MSKLKNVPAFSIKAIYLSVGVLVLLLLAYFIVDAKYVPTIVFVRRSDEPIPASPIKIASPSSISTAASNTNDSPGDAENDLSSETIFTYANAESRLGQMVGALTSFNRFTDLVRTSSNLNKDYGQPLIDPNRIPKNARIVSQFSGEALIEIGNLDWETQNLGFANWPKSVMAYIDYQEYEIAKLKSEIAVLKKQPAEQIAAMEQEVKQKKKYLRESYLDPEAWAD